MYILPTEDEKSTLRETLIRFYQNTRRHSPNDTMLRLKWNKIRTKLISRKLVVRNNIFQSLSVFTNLYIFYCYRKSRDSSVDVAKGSGLKGRGSIAGRSINISLLHKVLRGSGAQPPNDWVPGDFSLGLRQPWREADHSSPMPRSRRMELYLHSHISLSRSA
jgi:hypothetical protein